MIKNFWLAYIQDRKDNIWQKQKTAIGDIKTNQIAEKGNKQTSDWEYTL